MVSRCKRETGSVEGGERDQKSRGDGSKRKSELVVGKGVGIFGHNEAAGLQDWSTSVRGERGRLGHSGCGRRIRGDKAILAGGGFSRMKLNAGRDGAEVIVFRSEIGKVAGVGIEAGSDGVVVGVAKASELLEDSKVDTDLVDLELFQCRGKSVYFRRQGFHARKFGL